MAEMEKIDDVKKTLMGWIELETGKGIYGDACCDVEALGEVVDMAKDLGELKEKCWKAKYYELLVCAMKEEKDEEGRFGYDNWRYPSSGRFAPKGSGRRMGYPPDLMMYEDGMGEIWNAPYGYQNGRSNRSDGSSGGRGGSYQGRDSRMGYPMGDRSRYGRAYDEYQDAKRYYTQNKDEMSKHQMNEKIEESLMDTMDTFSEMYEDADPSLKKQMIEDMSGMLKKLEEKMKHMS